MPRVVTARYESEQAAEHALEVVGAEVPLLDSAVLSQGPTPRLRTTGHPSTRHSMATTSSCTLAGRSLL